jgi:hypothetical protein
MGHAGVRLSYFGGNFFDQVAKPIVQVPYLHLGHAGTYFGFC